MALNQVGLERLNTATTKKIGTNKNIIINGAMQVAQRATSVNKTGATTSYASLDRYRIQIGQGTITESQQDLSSSDAPYSKGFRKFLRVLNQSGIGAAANQYLQIDHLIEAQDIAQSGWDYTSSSSFITLSFWVRASVTQAYYGWVRTEDGTSRFFPYKICDSGGTTLTADTWTKIEVQIPGDSGITINNDTGAGVLLSFLPYLGTNNTTGSGPTLNAWESTGSGNNYVPDMTTTWATTTNATFDITGIQLEVGSVATDFEHRSFADELFRCQRYYYKQSANDNQFFRGMGMADTDGNSVILNSPFPTTMRIAPTAIEQSGTASEYKIRRSTSATCTSVPSFGHATQDQLVCVFTKSSHGFGDGSAVRCMSGTAGGFLAVSAEL